MNHTNLPSQQTHTLPAATRPQQDGRPPDIFSKSMGFPKRSRRATLVTSWRSGNAPKNTPGLLQLAGWLLAMEVLTKLGQSACRSRIRGAGLTG